MADPHDVFQQERARDAQEMAASARIRHLTDEWIVRTAPYKYSYNFTWMGRPLVQFPQDMVAMQEIIWRVQPDLIIECGVAHGGSVIYYASLLELCGRGRVVGIDVEVRAHNRTAIETHPMSRRISLVEGSSVDPTTLRRVTALIEPGMKVLVSLDSNHTHEHVLRELELYSPLVTKGSYLVVFDTIIEDMPPGSFPDRPWDIGNNPKTAVHEFLNTNKRFRIDKALEAKLLITVAPDGYLECIED